jgi:hypothetical protein
VTQAGTEQPLAGVIVTVDGTIIKGVSNTRGVYTIENVPAGARTLTFRWLGYRPVQASATVTAGSATTVDAKMEQLPIQLSELMVTGASKVPERSVEAPAAFSIVEPRVLQANGITGQVPMALREIPGGSGSERHERLQRERARLQLDAQPAGAGAAGRARPRHRIPRLAGMERDGGADR